MYFWNFIFIILARAESALEKQLKEEEKILESVAEKRGLCYEIILT